MSSPDHPLAERVAAIAAASDQSDLYVDFLVVTQRRSSPQFSGAPVLIEDTPLLCSKSEPVQVGNTPGIPLPDGQFLFYCRAATPDFLRLAGDPAFLAAYVADSWEALFMSDFPYWDLVFQAEAHRVTLTGNRIRWHGTFAELQPGDEIISVNVPGIFLGDEPPRLELSEVQRGLYVPRLDRDPDVETDPPANEFIYFFIDNFGVNLPEAPWLDLEGGATWWPASSFPASPWVHQHADDRSDPLFGIRTFTGVLTYPFPEGNLNDQQRRDFLETARNRVRRLRTLLQVLYGARVRLVGEMFYDYFDSSRVAIHRQLYKGPEYRWPNDRRADLRASRYSPDTLRDAAALAFDAPGKTLRRYVQRSLDSLDLARSLTDLPVAHVLTWAAIESLISPSDKSELIANMTLALIGLHPGIDRTAFWERAKTSYNVRSSIVHSFDFPEAPQLREALDFAEGEVGALLVYTLEEALPNGTSKDAMTKDLRARAFA